MSKITALDIIVPVRNEEKNILPLVTRIDKTFESKRKFYRIVFVLDLSIDKTEDEIKKLQKIFPIVLVKKQGAVGKASSILQGAAICSSEYVALLDGDLEYPPEALAEMLQKIPAADVVVANRKNHTGGVIRKLGSKTSRFILSKLYLKHNIDVQSGLKLFRKSLLELIDEKALKPWSFDFPLLFVTLEHGYTVDSVDITYTPRTEGNSKVNLWKTARDILWNATKTVWGAKRTHTVLPTTNNTMIGAGVTHNRQKYITHSTIPHDHSALNTFTKGQVLITIGILAVIIFCSFLNLTSTVIALVAVLTFLYFSDIIFSLVILAKSLSLEPELTFPPDKIKKIKDANLPVYSILCPLYKEGNVLPEFITSINNLDWPKEKLDVLLLLEENDPETIATARQMHLPKHFRVVIVPHSLPKTKPKACNYGLALAKGEYVVIYDAEDKPDADQLKKAYLGFKSSKEDTVCLQAKLNYYNPDHNLLTRLFTAEYSLWFDVTLPGLQSVGTTIPLGGTSNHFRTEVLKILHGWDAFNVTEDCDLGARLFKQGFKTAIIDSVTLEEANSNPKNWLRQRSRWIKGYFQTYLVHNRNFFGFLKTHGYQALLFQLVIGIRTTFILINPLLWLLTISYFTLYQFVGPTIESFYPAPIFYMAVTSLVFGNFIYLYNYMIGCAKRGHWSTIKYVFLVPFYWLAISIAGTIAAWQLITKPHYWEKTIHGLHLKPTLRSPVASANVEVKSIEKNTKKAHLSKTIEVLRAGGLMVVISMASNLLNLLYNIYLGRVVTLESFGLISLFSSFLYLTQIPFSALSTTVTHKSASLLGRLSLPAFNFWIKTRASVVRLSVVACCLWLISIPWLQQFFNAHSTLPFLIFTPVWAIGAAAAVDSGFINGSFRFNILAVITLSEALTKFALTIIFVSLSRPDWVYASIPASMLVSLLFGYLVAKKTGGYATDHARDQVHSISFPKRFFLASASSNLSVMAFISLDVIFAKILLSATDAGAFALLALCGKMIFFVSSIFIRFINPVVSKIEGAGQSSFPTFFKLLLLITAVSLSGFLTIGIGGIFFISTIFGSKATAIIPFLPQFALALTYYTVAISITTYREAKRDYFFSYFGLIFIALEIYLFSNSPKTIGSLVQTVHFTATAYLTSITILHILYNPVLNFVKKLVVTETPNKHSRTAGKRILIFNWRDTKHVWAGGAEVYVHELGKRWVKKGNQVTIFCSSDRRSPRRETIDGVDIIRRGGFFTVYVWAAAYYFLRFKGHFDIIIDCENGVPFFTPLYAKEKIFLLIHHVHQEVFRKGLPYPAYLIATFLEQILMPFVYRNIQILTVSPSSKADILGHRMTKKEPIIIYNGVDLEKMKPGKKTKNPTVLYLGRLKDYKSVPVLLKAAKNIIADIPTTRFIIAGDGPDKNKLVRLTKKLDLDSHVEFLGRVSEETKIALYQKSWVLVNPSLMEGWGITTIEANACATPAIGSNVPGLRDAIKNPHSGILVPYGNVDEFSKAIKKIITDSNLRKQMMRDSVEWAKKFDWEKSATQSLSLINL